ncbi:tyrosine-type recombinase/integrase [Sinorhizobium fredii]|uniref:tyrosine-type recombinase/integrase n=1 Tax=Rhizobium fredii TaxID=380 RepID=UPI001F0A7C28|nr:tyrosine-type recombinase/integrase [Sinorhizobium fredii]
MSECLLRWPEVNWISGQIITTGKKGRRIVIPITPKVREILWPLRGHHEEFVFTYVARHTFRNRRIGGQLSPLIKGQRYPITYGGPDKAWRKIRKDASLQDFRIHDFRHDLATKLLRETGNLKLVQRALNHADIKTTARLMSLTRTWRPA